MCLICHSEGGALHVFVARGLRWGHRKVGTETKHAEQIPTSSVDCGFFGQPEDRAHNTLPVLIVRDRREQWHLESAGVGKLCGAPIPCKGFAD